MVYTTWLIIREIKFESRNLQTRELQKPRGMKEFER